jgi:hypothetical protein
LWYITGEWNNLTIARALNEMTITRPDGSQVQARQKGRGYENGPGPFTRDVVRDMLKRLAYTGQLPYQGVDANGRHRKHEEPSVHNRSIWQVRFQKRFTWPRKKNGNK